MNFLAEYAPWLRTRFGLVAPGSVEYWSIPGVITTSKVTRFLHKVGMTKRGFSATVGIMLFYLPEDAWN